MLLGRLNKEELARIQEHHSTHGVVLPYSHDRVRRDIMQTIDAMQLDQPSIHDSSNTWIHLNFLLSHLAFCVSYCLICLFINSEMIVTQK